MDISIIASASISSAGINAESIFNAINEGKQLSIERIYNSKKYPIFSLHNDAYAKVEELIKLNKHIRKTDICVQYALVSVNLMLNELNENLKGRGLINIASSRGNTSLFEDIHKSYLDCRETSIYTSPLTTLGNVSSEVSSFLNIDNLFPIESSQTCSSASQAILNGIAWLKSGMVDWAIVGGSEAPLTPFTLAQVEALGIYSDKLYNDFPCRPFNNEEKNTFVLGEGASVFLLKRSLDTNNSIAKIISYGADFQNPPSKTGINEDGGPLLNSMKQAIEKTLDKPDLILAHAPGTIKGDRAEINAINNIFSKEKPSVLSTKFICGHTYGASSALNIDLAIEILKNKTINLQYPYSVYIDENKKQNNINNIMINSTGFGGNAVSLIIKL